jgi:predicted RNA-binding protein with PUA-like domain
MSLKKRYWLMKSEPSIFSIGDLKACKVTCWDGVRNYQARNFIRDEMKVGEGVLFYHSNAKPTGIAGLAVVVKKAYRTIPPLTPKISIMTPRVLQISPSGTWWT